MWPPAPGKSGSNWMEWNRIESNWLSQPHTRQLLWLAWKSLQTQNEWQIGESTTATKINGRSDTKQKKKKDDTGEFQK